MKEIKILISRHYHFGTEHNTSLTINSILPIIQKKFNVKIIWFFYFPEKIDFDKHNKNEEVIDIHDFNNALEIIDKIKPDLVFDSEFPSLMDLSLDFAAKFRNIPVVTKIISSDEERITIKQFFTSFFPMFFHNLMPYEKGKKKFMKRGRFFLFKYRFFLKTLFKIKFNMFKILKYFLITLKWHIRYESPYIDSRLANSLHFLENESLKQRMIRKGFEENSLVVTGNPIYDKIFKKYQQGTTKQETTKTNNQEKMKILLAPIQLYEGGIWTKKQRDTTIRLIVKKLVEYKKQFTLIVKIHPTSQSLKEYEKLIHDIDDSIEIFQEGTIEDYLDEVDTVLSFGTVYSSLIPVLIAQKKLIICNFINYEPVTPIDTRVATECKDINSLIDIIKKQNNFQEHKTKINLYLNEIMYKTDGLASERLAKALTELILIEKNHGDKSTN